MATRYELEQELKKARKAVLTLGLSLVPFKMLFEDAAQADKGFSFAGTVFGYTFRVLWFLLWLVISMTILWVTNIFKWIYYAIVTSGHKTQAHIATPQRNQPEQPQLYIEQAHNPSSTAPQNLGTKKSKSSSFVAIAITLIMIICLVIVGVVFFHKKNQSEVERSEVFVTQKKTDKDARMRREADEKHKKSEELARKRDELLSQGYIDLGLPSGTLWKNTNEEGYYTFNQAKQRFGNNVPTKEQWEELIKNCSWQWSGWNYDGDRGYYVKGRNGASIFLPSNGCEVAKEGYHLTLFRRVGFYWSSTISEKGPYTFTSYRTYCDDETKEEDFISTHEYGDSDDVDNGYSIRLAY